MTNVRGLRSSLGRLSTLVAPAAPVGALFLTLAVGGCGSTQNTGPVSPSSAGNIPGAPPVDRSRCKAEGKQVTTADTNMDGKPDVWNYYEDEELVRIERDADFNGKVDQWEYYEGGKRDRIGYDTTGAGKVDKWDRAPEGGDVGAPAAAPPASPPPATTTAPPAAAPPAPAAPPAKQK